ncbi:Conserved oligomeric complex COG6 family protein [Coccidioides posadasii C735 delta SOWgp]|uniref:Conserved oligomeric Golgi complex subunit 6 n=1 Tax=Coccidioides posadasii (strain C735) TaxID=222929 RepID=C5PFS2_COCP7|nr:Conserved oligomeric complex COG6 family protein [Coccidioides posadasii C735 delta SOWgp]EER23375.1 Conserved oligomeric complex COG6 family protein [Coccidioides posadasii C735 delta SOWgp]|eukprot:XP_003065520.1 Conserved oligomeric complex COG6 family protein [Coccidioides posadasii C735 delta SOWgp]
MAAGSPSLDGMPSSPHMANTGSTPKPTALFNRLNAVLSTSYTDPDIRDSLETLDKRGLQNTAETRRTLRLDIQKEVIDSNGSIIQDFGKVAEQLSRIGAAISHLNTICEDMRQHITSARQETEPVLEEAAALLSQKQEVETKQHLLDAFNKHFILSSDDISILTSTAEPVDDRFFQILSRQKWIHKDCEVLLGGENQRLGLEIMEQSSKNLNSAFMKLYKWIQKEFKSSNLEDPQMGSSIRKGLRVLAERPTLFHSCLNFFAEAREYILSDSFHYALTAAVSGDRLDANAKPIEFSAHDPLRYVGDMLAWVHSATVSEREALEALFISDGGELVKGIEAGISSEPWSRINDEQSVFDGEKALKELVTRDMSGVARSLKQRVELAVQGHDELVTLYKIMNLLAFYESTFSKLVGHDSALVEAITSLQDFVFKRLEAVIHDQTATITGDPSGLIPPDDLSAPEFLTDAIDNLVPLMKAYDSSFRHEITDDTSQNENKFSPIIRATLDPFLDLAEKSSTALSNFTSRTIYQTNSILVIRDAISPFPFACATHLPRLSSTLTSLKTNLLDIQHDFLLRETGLQPLIAALEPFMPKSTSESSTGNGLSRNLADIASLPEFQPESLSTISQQLDDFLPSALVDATDNLKRIHSPGLVKNATEEAVEAFCCDFELVESMIVGADEAREKMSVAGTVSSSAAGKEMDEIAALGETGGQVGAWSLRVLFPRTTGEIRVLLS